MDSGAYNDEARAENVPYVWRVIEGAQQENTRRADGTDRLTLDSVAGRGEINGRASMRYRWERSRGPPVEDFKSSTD